MVWFVWNPIQGHVVTEVSKAPCYKILSPGWCPASCSLPTSVATQATAVRKTQICSEVHMRRKPFALNFPLGASYPPEVKARFSSGAALFSSRVKNSILIKEQLHTLKAPKGVFLFFLFLSAVGFVWNHKRN